ncbi:hypothetical protein F5Y04DRAFT_228062 [Hypomontagnella monticulosa]|nr:hypothetical protein F5Y04DRAFT_228062 [Hypomontagnella monticulosa]
MVPKASSGTGLAQTVPVRQAPATQATIAQSRSHAYTPASVIQVEAPASQYYYRPNAYQPRRNMPAPTRPQQSRTDQAWNPHQGRAGQPTMPQQAQMPGYRTDPYRWVTLPSQRAMPAQPREAVWAREYRGAMGAYNEQVQQMTKPKGKPSVKSTFKGSTPHTSHISKGSVGSWKSIGVDPMHGPRAVFHHSNPQSNLPNKTMPTQKQVPANQPGGMGRMRSVSKASKSSNASTIRPTKGAWTAPETRPRFGSIPIPIDDAIVQALTSPSQAAAASPAHILWNTAQGGNTRNRSRAGSRATPAMATTRASFGASGPSITAPPPTTSQPREGREEVECVNKDKYTAEDSFLQKYDPCPCRRCRDADRTIFIQGVWMDGSIKKQDVLFRVEEEFCKYGAIQSAFPQKNGNGVFVKYTKHDSAARAVAKANHRRVTSLGPMLLRVAYRIGSQYHEPYQSLKQTHDTQGSRLPFWSPGHTSRECLEHGPPPPMPYGPPDVGVYPGFHGHPAGSFGPTAYSTAIIASHSESQDSAMSQTMTAPHGEERLLGSQSSNSTQGYYTPPEHPVQDDSDDMGIYDATPRPSHAKPVVQSDSEGSEVNRDTVIIRRPDMSRRPGIPPSWESEPSETHPQVPNNPKYYDAQDKPTMTTEDQSSKSSHQYVTASAYQSAQPSPSHPITVRLPPSSEFPPSAAEPSATSQEKTPGSGQQDMDKGAQSTQTAQGDESGKKSRRNSEAKDQEQPSGGNSRTGEGRGRQGRARKRQAAAAAKASLNPMVQPMIGPAPRPTSTPQVAMNPTARPFVMQQPYTVQPLVQPYGGYQHGANTHGYVPEHYRNQPFPPLAHQHPEPRPGISQEEADFMDFMDNEIAVREMDEFIRGKIQHRQRHAPTALTRTGSLIPYPESAANPVFPTGLTRSPLQPGSEARSRSRGPPHVTPGSRPNSKSPDKAKFSEKKKAESPEKSKTTGESKSPVKAEKEKSPEEPVPMSEDSGSVTDDESSGGSPDTKAKKRRWVRKEKVVKGKAKEQAVEQPATSDTEPTPAKTPIVPASTLALVDPTAQAPERPTRTGLTPRAGHQRGRGRAGRKQQDTRPRGPYGATMPMLTSADFPNLPLSPQFQDSPQPTTSAWSRGPPSFASGNVAGASTSSQGRGGSVSGSRAGSQSASQAGTSRQVPDPSSSSNVAMAGTAGLPYIASGNASSPAAQTSERKTQKVSPKKKKSDADAGNDKKENKKPASDDRKGG